MHDDEHEQSEVHGTILLILHLQRLIGLAPVHIRKRGSKHFICTSRLYMYLGCIFATTLCIVIITELIWHTSSKGTNDKDFTQTPSSTFLWFVDFLSILGLSCLGSYGAKERINRLIYYSKQTKKENAASSYTRKIDDLIKVAEIHAHINGGKRTKTNEIFKSAIIIIGMLWVVVCISSDFYNSLIWQTEKKSKLTVYYSYIITYIECIVLYSVEIMFILTVQLFTSSLYLINYELEKIFMDIKNDVSVNLEENDFGNPPVQVCLKSINKVVDQLAIMKLKRPASAVSEQIEEKLRQLLRQHSRVCDLVAMFNEHDGLMFLIVIIDNMKFLVFLSYDVVGAINLAGWDWNFFYFGHFIWISFVIISVVAIVVACQRTSAEVKKSKELVSCLMRKCHGSDPVHNVLEGYYYRLLLDNVQYSAYGLFTLDGNLFFKIMAGVISYLLIFRDFGFDTRFS